MAAAEAEHLAWFDKELVACCVRPTAACTRSGHVAGYALGAATALMGPQGVDGLHGRRRGGDLRALQVQEEALGETEPELKDATSNAFTPTNFNHYDTALEHEAEKVPRNRAATVLLIKRGVKTAIWLAERI